MGNSAGGNIEAGPGPATVISSTITGNYTAGPNTGSTGGIFNGSSVTLKNSIVAANYLDDGIPDTTGFGNITSGGFNLIGNPGAMTSFTQPGDQAGVPNRALDPKLAAISLRTEVTH